MPSPSDRFQVVETALMPPGVCRVCGGASKDWYIDFGYNEDTYGAVYYCNECIGAMAEACGFLTPATRELLEKKVAALEAHNFDLKVRSDGMEMILDGLRLAGFAVSRLDGGSDSNLPSPAFAGAPEVAEAPQRGADPEQRPGAESGTRTGETAEPGGEPGVADLRSGGGEQKSGDFQFSV